MTLPTRLRLTCAVLAGLLLGCGLPGEAPKEREKRVFQTEGDMSRAHNVDAISPRIDGEENRPPAMNEGGSPLDLPRSDGALRTVRATIELDAMDRPEAAALVLLGFRAVDITAKGALKPGRRPQWYWASPLRAIEGTDVIVQAPLPAGLSMFALLDLDGDLAPGQGEYMSAIIRDFAPPPPDGVATFPLDRRFGTD